MYKRQTPGNPDLAEKLAEKAASVTHDRNGIYGGIFVAVCISYAFVEKDIFKIIEKALSYLPADCEYVRVVRAVMKCFESYGTNGDWEACYRYIFEHYGYDKYQGCLLYTSFTVVVTSISTVLGLALSVFLNRPFVGKKLVNSIIILSYVVPAVCLLSLIHI